MVLPYFPSDFIGLMIDISKVEKHAPSYDWTKLDHWYKPNGSLIYQAVVGTAYYGLSLQGTFDGAALWVNTVKCFTKPANTTGWTSLPEADFSGEVGRAARDLIELALVTLDLISVPAGVDIWLNGVDIQKKT